MSRKKKEVFGLESLNLDGANKKKILGFIFDQCVKALDKHRDKNAPREFAREAIRRFGKLVEQDDILIEIIAAE